MSCKEAAQSKGFMNFTDEQANKFIFFLKIKINHCSGFFSDLEALAMLFN